MKIIKIMPGREPEMVDIDNTLKALQQAVGGYIGPLMGQLLVGTVLVVRAAPGAEDFSGVRACDLGLIRACWVPVIGERNE